MICEALGCAVRERPVEATVANVWKAVTPTYSGAGTVVDGR
jgi:hypothetical protein